MNTVSKRLFKRQRNLFKTAIVAATQKLWLMLAIVFALS